MMFYIIKVKMVVIVLIMTLVLYSDYVFRGISIGGKGSTEYEVKGSHKEVSQELIDELKDICQVWSFVFVFFFKKDF